TMKKAAEDLEKITIPIINVYKAQVRDKINEEEIRDLMDNETWMSADEALDYGFVDRIKGKIKAIAKVGKNQILCSGRLMDVGKYHYRNVPKYPEIDKSKGTIMGEEIRKAAQEKPKQKEITNMTREEIDPQLLSQIQMEARVAE